MYASRPSSAFGYYRGMTEGPFWQGQGSGAGMAANTQGVGVMSQGQGSIASPGGWHPTILYLILFVLAEMVVFGLLSKHLR